AATTAVLISVVGLASPAALLYSAIPMLGIAWAFNYLGRADVNAGASYSWVGRALHPALGFLSGWALVVSATVFMVACSLPPGWAAPPRAGPGPGLPQRVGAGGLGDDLHGRRLAARGGADPLAVQRGPGGQHGAGDDGRRGVVPRHVTLAHCGREG